MRRRPVEAGHDARAIRQVQHAPMLDALTPLQDEVLMSMRMFVLATACLVALIACDAKTSAVDPGFAPPKPDAEPKADAKV